jgi:hypothetical protein
MSIAAKPKKRGRPATGRDPMIGLRAPLEFTKALDRASAREDDQPSRSEMIRRIVTEWLKAKGYLK